MSDVKFKIKKGLQLKPVSSTGVSELGDLESLTSSGKLNYHNGTTASPVTTEAHTATLTNKTIDADLNTITNIENADIKAGAAIDASKIADGSVSNTEFQYLGGVTSDLQTQLNNKLGTTLATANTLIGNGSNVATAVDTSAVGDISADSSTGLNIKSGVIVDADINASAAITRTKLASGTADHVLINNGSGVISSEAQLDRTRGGTGVSSTATFPTSGVIVTETATETLSNKTLDDSTTTLQNTSDPTKTAKIDLTLISTGTNRTAYLPDTDGELVIKDANQVLTNKDVDGGTASNTRRITLPKAAKATLDGLTRKEGTLVYASDQNKVYADDGSTLVELAANTPTAPVITTLGGSGTHTVTGSPLYMRIRLWGGGGGGSGSGTTNGSNGGDGGASTFDTASAGGGTGAAGAGSGGSGGGGAGGSVANFTGGDGQTRLGSSGVYGGDGGAGAMGGAQGSGGLPGGVGYSGKAPGGGGGGAGFSGSNNGAGGGGGGYCEHIISNPSGGYSYSVGGGGLGGSAGSGGSAGGDGGSGSIIVEEYYQ
jgi:hypothetical protein